MMPIKQKDKNYNLKIFFKCVLKGIGEGLPRSC